MECAVKSRTIIRIALFVTVAMILAIVAGCGESEKKNGGEAPKVEQKLTMGLNASARILDPHKTTNYGDERIMNQLYDGLVALDFDLITIKPSLAESWTVSEDGKTYVFTLRQDVKFHSGKPLTASDVKYSFDRWRDEKTASPTSYKLGLVESVETEGDYTVKITLSATSNTFLLNLTAPYAFILNQEAVEAAGEDYGTKSVDGTGPFIFKEWIPDDRIVCTRNEEYKWGSDVYKNKGPAFLETLVFRFLPEAGTREMEFETGNVDMLTPGSIPRADVERLKSSDKVTAVIYDQPYTDFIGFKLTVPYLKDVRVRQAMNYAIDRKALVDDGIAGLGDPGYGPIAPVTFGYNPEVEQIGYPYDTAKAEALLEEAGWAKDSDGFRYKDGKKLVLKIHYCGGQEYDVVVPMVQAQLRAVGIDVKLVQMEFATLINAINAGEHDSFVMGLNYAHPDGILGYYFRSTNRPYPNRFEFVNKRVDELLDTGISAPAKEDQIAAYQEVQKIIVEEAVWIPLFYQKGVMGVSKSLKDFTPHAMVAYGIPKFMDVHK